MKNAFLKVMLLCAVWLSSSQYAHAQLVIKVRPAAPRIVRVAAPSPKHVWIEEDWAWRNNNYVYTGGYYAVPPSGYATWVPGHWKQSKRGWIWRPGHWR